MTAVRPAAAGSAGRAPVGRRWWLWLVLPGILLSLAPAAAIALTNRDPDPLFMRFWWTPIAEVPTPALLIGSVGLDLLLATGVVALLGRAVRGRRAPRPAIRAGAALALAVLVGLGWSLLAGAHADASRSAVVRALISGGSASTRMSEQASEAVAQVLAWPTSPTSRVHVLDTSSVPAGPWIVQTTEVRNENAQDEGADVVIETLVDPVDGDIVAGWYSGM